MRSGSYSWRGGRRGAALGLVLVASLVFLPAPAQAEESYPVEPGGTFTFVGHGYGHGRGLSQWGAHGAAVAGLTTNQILAFYYPGTSITGQPDTDITVRLTTGRLNELAVDAAPGLALRWQGGTLPLPTTSAGNRIVSWRLFRGPTSLLLDFVDTSAPVWHRYSVVPGSSATFLSSSGRLRLVQPDFQRREYRGGLGLLTSGSSGVVTFNAVRMEQYVPSVLPAEMPSSWPPAALRAQAVAARTYASHQRHFATGSTHTCDTTACQVYPGVALYALDGRLVRSYEATSTTAAVAETANQVLITGGAFSYAFTQFSSSNGGWSAAGSQPYLVAKPDPYDGLVPNGAHRWTQSVAASRVAAAYPAVGQPQRLTVLGRDGRGEWGGRISLLRVDGSAGSATVSGDAFRSATGLRSTWWSTARATQTAGGVMRDVTGDGIPDAFGRDGTRGTLSFYAGRADGSFSAPRVVGTGWGMHDWIGSPGDVTRDGVPDLYAREAATGVLWLYELDRTGVARSRRAVGTGWHTVDQIVLPGDVTGDGVPDVYGRNATTGALQFYAGAGGGALSPPRTVDAGWHSLDAIVGIGDLTSDGVPDLLGRRRTDGALVLYPARRDGTIVSATVVNRGWAPFDMIVSANGAGGAALYARSAGAAKGTLVRYPVRPGGVVDPGVAVGTGWNLHTSVS